MMHFPQVPDLHISSKAYFKVDLSPMKAHRRISSIKTRKQEKVWPKLYSKMPNTNPFQKEKALMDIPGLHQMVDSRFPVF